MNIPILHWSVIFVLDTSLQALEHMTQQSFPQQSSTEYPIPSVTDSLSQRGPSQPLEAPGGDDAIWSSAGPYDDDGEAEMDKDMF